MASSVHGIERRLMDEPHVSGHRVSVRRIYTLVEADGRDAGTVADSLGLDVADVYRALAYYHDNPREMHDVEARREQRIEQSRERGAPVGPDDL